MTSVAYRRYLRSPLWRAHRWVAFAFWGLIFGHGRCAACGTWKLLQGHHMTYASLGHEWPWQVLPLSRGCHRVVTKLGDVLSPILGRRWGRVVGTWIWVAVRGWWVIRLWPLWALLVLHHYGVVSILWHAP